MREELIISGRMNPNIDPVLNVWHWHIPLYLFLGGLAAGLLFFAAYYVINGKEKQFPAAVKFGPIIALIAIIIGLIALVLDLKHPAYFWQLYTTIRFESPMSWGAWTLLIITFINIIWIFSYFKEIFPKFNLRIKFFRRFMKIFIVEVEGNGDLNWDWKYKWMKDFEKYTENKRKAWAWVMIVFAVILGVYTGILLSAFNARPLWNTALLGPLFLTSGLSTGAALLMIMAKDHLEKITFSKIDLLLIVIELFFITHMFMGFLAGSEVKADAAHHFLGGEFTVSFWVNVIILGLIIPAILESLKLLKFKVPIIVPALLILYSGIMFRFIMVEAGQVIRYLY
jgi:formate-dependent nitrite reductase membrane component NrfD